MWFLFNFLIFFRGVRRLHVIQHTLVAMIGVRIYYAIGRALPRIGAWI